MRARPLGVEDVELRDRDGGYVRAQDSGAAVVLVGAAPAQPAADDDVDVIVLALPGGGDERIEVTGSAALAPADSCAAIVVLGDDVAQDAAAAAAATALADKLGARVITSRASALAPELCVTIGAAASASDVAGASTVVRVGHAGKFVDAAVPGAPGEILDELVKKLARPS